MDYRKHKDIYSCIETIQEIVLGALVTEKEKNEIGSPHHPTSENALQLD